MRKVKKIIKSMQVHEGAGFIVNRPFPVPGLREIDPFLLIDEMGPTHYAPGEAKGAPDHPHRGFETISYLLEGGLLHEDSGGSISELRKGDVQWMTAGRGVVHSEVPLPDVLKDGGPMHAFQIWVNLPKAKKLTEPRYQDIRSSEIPLLSPGPGVILKLISGRLLTKTGPAKNETPILYAHVRLAPLARWETEEIEKDKTILAYVISGNGNVADSAEATRTDLVQFEMGEGELKFENPSTENEFEFLLLAGSPINEPVARMGPFVMNTRQELEQAYEDYMSGRLGVIRRAAALTEGRFGRKT
jgi:quercetin 2,3-dioxygenase